MPEISVVMPVYNTKEEFFRCAIDSILKQTYTDFELLIADDCSDGYIEKIVKSYPDKRISYLRLEQNAGSAVAKNLAIQHAKGKYIAFLDSDDIALPDRLAAQYDFLEKHPDIGCLGTVFYILKHKRMRRVYHRIPLKNEDIVNSLF